MKIHAVSCLILLVLGLAACAREGEAVPTATRPATAAASPVATRTPRPTATATLTPEPTPVVPAIAVSNQPLADDGRVTIDRVTVTEPGWLVLHAEREGQVAEVLSFTAVDTGANDNIVVTVDPHQVTPSLVAMLHTDAGEPGEFEFPGPDEPLQWDATVVMTSFDLDFQLVMPALTIADQVVGEDGLIRAESATVSKPAWLLIFAEENGAAGPLLGSTHLEEGVNEELVIPIPWRQATPRLFAALHEDSGRPDRLDYPDEDLPMLAAGEPVVVPFQVTLPLDILVLDQPVLADEPGSAGKIVVERVISNGPGWLVVYQDEGGVPGLIIGSAPLDDGLNERVTVEVPALAVTPQLHIRLHRDTEPGDEFDFPAADPPATNAGQMPPPFTFRTNGGNYLITRDQPLSRENDEPVIVTIPFVVTDTPAWVVIYAFAGGQRGDILGVTLVPPGINREVLVELSAAAVGDTLHAVLHLDAGTAEQFDFPGGPDIPLQRNRALIYAPFTLVPAE